MRQYGPVDALRSQHVNVILLGELLWREGFGRAEHHVASIVYHHIKLPGVGYYRFNGSINRYVALNIKFQRPEVNSFPRGKFA